MTVAMPSHRRKGKHGVVNTQVQSHPLLRRGFGTSVPFHLGKQKVRQNVESCFIDKAVAKRLLDSCKERKGCRSNRCPAP